MRGTQPPALWPDDAQPVAMPMTIISTAAAEAPVDGSCSTGCQGGGLMDQRRGCPLADRQPDGTSVANGSLSSTHIWIGTTDR